MMHYFYITLFTFFISFSSLKGQSKEKIDSASYKLENIYWIYSTADLYDESYVEIDSVINIIKGINLIKIDILVTQYISSSASRHFGLLRAERLRSYFIQSGLNPEIIFARSKRIDEESFSKTKTEIKVYY